MTQRLMIGLLLACLTAIHDSAAFGLAFDDLRRDAPPCKQTKAKRPKIPADKELPYYDVLKLDINGDGWCDYTVKVLGSGRSRLGDSPVYDLQETMILGGEKGWQRLLLGKSSKFRSPISTLNKREWPIYSVDLTRIQLVFPRLGGAPYILGIDAAGSDDYIRWNHEARCSEFNTVYRWAPEVGAFRRVGEAEEKVVIKYYYAHVAVPCITIDQCMYHPDCRNIENSIGERR